MRSTRLTISRRIVKSACTRLWLVCLIGMPLQAGEVLTLHALDANDGVKESGLQLMNLDLGLHSLEGQTQAMQRIVVGVHGWRSQGYEWIYPLQIMDDDQSITYFFRWDWEECPVDGGRELLRQLNEEVPKQTDLKQIVIVGHSLGGLLVASVADSWDIAVSSDLHIVASPLRAIDRGECDQSLPSRLKQKAQVRFFEWRTRQELDNAFKDMPIDPQVVDIETSLVVTLPEEYRGRRLGHNWSVSWVAERVATQK